VTTPPPTTAPTPAPNQQYAAACGEPLPPLKDAYGFKVKVQLEPSKNKKILNASPQVANPDFCSEAGFGPIPFCNTRLETEPTRVPCDYYITGVSGITGKPGPNWYEEVGGQLVRCGTGAPGESEHCFLKPENQFLLDVYAGGIYKSCGSRGSTGTCGVCIIDDSAFEKVHHSPAGLCDNNGDDVVPAHPESLGVTE
jgi:hypothetical protein